MKHATELSNDELLALSPEERLNVIRTRVAHNAFQQETDHHADYDEPDRVAVRLSFQETEYLMDFLTARKERLEKEIGHRRANPFDEGKSDFLFIAKRDNELLRVYSCLQQFEDADC